MRNILCNVRRLIPILVTKVWRQNLDYVKNLQVKYFTGENIRIYDNNMYPWSSCSISLTMIRTDLNLKMVPMIPTAQMRMHGDDTSSYKQSSSRDDDVPSHEREIIVFVDQPATNTDDW